MNNFQILYIDDEVNNLISFKANLRDYYKIITTTSVEESFEILNNNHNIRIVFCDKKMPKINGIDYFEIMKKKYPTIIRIIISAYTNTEDIIKSINKCHIFKYLEKPMDFNIIKNTIEEANQYFMKRNFININKENFNIKEEEKDKNIEKEDILERLCIINNLIRHGYNKVICNFDNKYNNYIESIKDSNFFAIKHDLLKLYSNI